MIQIRKSTIHIYRFPLNKSKFEPSFHWSQITINIILIILFGLLITYYTPNSFSSHKQAS